MACTAPSTSAAFSRFADSRAANRASKSASRVSSRHGIVSRQRVARGVVGRPGGPEIGELCLQALDRKTEAWAAGEIEQDVPGRSRARLEADRQQFQHRFLRVAIDAGG